jgi:hypothetical protein
MPTKSVNRKLAKNPTGYTSIKPGYVYGLVIWVSSICISLAKLCELCKTLKIVMTIYKILFVIAFPFILQSQNALLTLFPICVDEICLEIVFLTVILLQTNDWRQNVEGLSQTQYHVRPHIDMSFSRDGYEANCFFGYDATYHDTNLESGGDSSLQNVGEFLQDNTVWHSIWP